jgi:hypothetical protein
MLTKKNKDVVKLIGALFALVVVAFAFMRAKKKTDANPSTTLATNLQGEVKALLTA